MIPNLSDHPAPETPSTVCPNDVYLTGRPVLRWERVSGLVPCSAAWRQVVRPFDSLPVWGQDEQNGPVFRIE